MAETKLYNLINNSSLFPSFLLEHNLIFDPETISQLNLTCRNANCRDRNKGFKSSTRKRNLTQRNAERFLQEGQGVLRIDCLKCKSCKTTLSPRTGGFLTYLDSARRSNCKISTAKKIADWTAQRPIVDSIQTLGLAKPTVFENGMVHYTLLGDGHGRNPSGETPRIVIQIDQSLLRGRRMYNRGRIFQGNEAISADDQREFTNMQEGGEEVNINRNFERQIASPWIFGMVECHKQPDGSYKSKEVRWYHVDRRDANTLLPIIRDNVTPGTQNLCGNLDIEKNFGIDFVFVFMKPHINIPSA
ncbi:hypothetical protein HZS_2834, partial [Henneguya salminicola]